MQRFVHRSRAQGETIGDLFFRQPGEGELEHLPPAGAEAVAGKIVLGRQAGADQRQELAVEEADDLAVARRGQMAAPAKTQHVEAMVGSGAHRGREQLIQARGPIDFVEGLAAPPGFSITLPAPAAATGFFRAIEVP